MAALAHNTFAVSVLSYISHLETPPPTLIDQETVTLRISAPGPGQWCSNEDLFHLLPPCPCSQSSYKTFAFVLHTVTALDDMGLYKAAVALETSYFPKSTLPPTTVHFHTGNTETITCPLAYLTFHLRDNLLLPKSYGGADVFGTWADWSDPIENRQMQKGKEDAEEAFSTDLDHSTGP